MACLVFPNEVHSGGHARRRGGSYDFAAFSGGPPFSPQMVRTSNKALHSDSTSDEFMRIQSVGGLSSAPECDIDLFCLIQQASLGLQRYPPELAREGDGGTYYLYNITGEVLAVYKPSDEDPQSQNNPKKKQRKISGNQPRSSNNSPANSFSSRSSSYCSTALRTSIPHGQTAIREVAAYALDRKFAAVPPTVLAQVQGWESSRILKAMLRRAKHYGRNILPSRFQRCGKRSCASPMPAKRSITQEEKTKMHKNREAKVGSLQKFVRNECGSYDRAPQMYSVEDVHRIGILDVRIFNTDRHGGNILVVQRDTPDEEGIFYSLVPIDHGYSFPINLSEANFEWMYWPQTRVPFPPHIVKYVEEICLEEDAELLRKCGLEEEAISVNRIATMLLKEGVRSGLNLHEIAKLCCGERGLFESPLEIAVASVCGELPTLASEKAVWVRVQQCISDLVAKIVAEK